MSQKSKHEQNNDSEQQQQQKQQQQQQRKITNKEKDTLQDWYKKRKNNMIIIYINTCIFVFEFSAITISALYYYKDTLKVSNPQLYYSLTLGSIYILVPVSSVIIGKYTDITRDVRKTALSVSYFNIVGNLFYVFPLFNWFPIIGRMLCGIPDGVKSAFVGELLSSI